MAVPVGQLEMLAYGKGCKEYSPGVIMLLDLAVHVSALVVPTVVAEGHGSVTDLDILVNAGLVDLVIDFILKLEIGILYQFQHLLILPVIPLAVVLEILLLGAPLEGEIVLEGGFGAAVGADHVISGSTDIEFAFAAWALVEHGLEPQCLVVALDKYVFAFLEIEFAVGEGGSDPFHDLVFAERSGLGLVYDAMGLDADLSAVGVGGPLGVAQSGAFDLACVDGDLEEADHLGDGRGDEAQVPAGIDGAFGGDVDRSFLFLDNILDLSHGLEVRCELVFWNCTYGLEPECEFFECEEVIGHQK